jgi:hypothetical protein
MTIKCRCLRSPLSVHHKTQGQGSALDPLGPSRFGVLRTTAPDPILSVPRLASTASAPHESTFCEMGTADSRRAALTRAAARPRGAGAWTRRHYRTSRPKPNAYGAALGRLSSEGGNDKRIARRMDQRCWRPLIHGPRRSLLTAGCGAEGPRPPAIKRSARGR